MQSEAIILYSLEAIFLFKIIIITIIFIQPALQFERFPNCNSYLVTY